MCGVPMASRRRPLGLLAARADCVRTPPLQLQPCSPIRLVTGLRPPPRPITGPRLGVSRVGAMRMVRVNFR